MADQQLETEGFSIVALGAFNPSIFQPLWFSGHNLIRSEEATTAKIDIIHRNAAVFQTEWLSLQVTEGNFTILTQDPTKSLPLRDLALGTFKLLEHTPLTAFGFNRFAHYRASSEESWHAFGHHFAPKESWNGILKSPGLLILSMEGEREGCDGKIQIRIEPSSQTRFGIVIAVNQHHDLQAMDVKQLVRSQADRNKALLSGLLDQWEDFLLFANHACKHLLAAPVVPGAKSTKKKKG